MRRAYFVAWMISPHVKEAPTPQDIYDGLWVSKEERKQRTKDKNKEDLEILKKEFGIA